MPSVTQSSLTEMVRRLVLDPSTSTAIRNECHRLLIAIEQNQHALMDECVARLSALADRANVTLHGTPFES
jgi:hypothetical protein